MSVYCVTGKLGSGKSLIAVSRIRDKLLKGLPVATNLDLKLYKMPGVQFSKKCRVIRIPDKPSIFDLEAIGKGNLSYDENYNGLLVLDECGTWFNSRSWADKERQKVINWFLHARKLGWDIIFLVQDISVMDKQARLSLAEHVVYCRRADRLNIPFIGIILNMLASVKISLPQIHFGVVKYGDNINSITVDRWIYRGRDLYYCYDTKQAFSDNYPDGVYSYIPPFYTHKRVEINLRYYMKITKIYLKKINRLFLAACFFALGFSVSYYYKAREEMKYINSYVETLGQKMDSDKTASVLPALYIDSFSREGDSFTVLLSDGNKTYDFFDLKSMGYSLSYINPCLLKISKGSYTQNVSCR